MDIINNLINEQDLLEINNGFSYIDSNSVMTISILKNEAVDSELINKKNYLFLNKLKIYYYNKNNIKDEIEYNNMHIKINKLYGILKVELMNEYGYLVYADYIYKQLYSNNKLPIIETRKKEVLKEILKKDINRYYDAEIIYIRRLL